ncbi:hemerythrin domain-containing protein [Sphingopyxis sp. KK2]|uniref:hemerythrin domain-containing protein n=1 Tax=Sphingopyxis sp. KK2 TaxID=1855727 RepID=UPI00211866B7|nr:hemerythrin domain-containing protein [Sphingopyxis sp. KK2]
MPEGPTPPPDFLADWHSLAAECLAGGRLGERELLDAARRLLLPASRKVDWPKAGGECGAIIRERDWSASPEELDMAVRTKVRRSPEAAKAAAISEAKAIAPDRAARIGSTPATTFRGDPNIFGRLVEDHDKHRALFAMIEDTVGKSPDRVRLFSELVHEIKGHAAAEEQALWSTVLRNPETTEDARHAVAEHKEIDDMFADLAARDMASPGWLRRFAATKEKYLHHIREEEQEQFVAAEKHLSPADMRHMRSVFNRRKSAEKSGAEVERKIKLKA